MPKPTKRSPKAAALPPIPEPFAAAPTELAPLLSTFDKDTVYITHIDHHPSWFKRRVFYVPVAMNVTIALLILWRAYVEIPWYWALTMSVLGNPNSTTIFSSQHTYGQIVWKVLRRAGAFIFDWIMLFVIGPWPWSFFFESPSNPVHWRLQIGFRDEEVYVRASRGWGAKDLLGEAEGATGKSGAESPFFRTRVLPAVDTKRMREKTGYLLMDKNFDLDFAGMVRATDLMDKKEISSGMLRKSVFVWVGTEEAGQWAMWDCWRLDEGSETEARQKIVLFKDKLTLMGKENLFFKWVELVQYESNAPGGFTQERQESTAMKAKRLFEEQGVDFDTFMKDIGGAEGLPGM